MPNRSIYSTTAVALMLMLQTGDIAQARTLNADLKSQVQARDERKLPCTDWYCLAMDNFLFYRMTRQGELPGYYHGGYWINGFVELTASDRLTFNSKIVAYNPSFSYGYNSTSYFHPFVSVAWTDNLSRYVEWNLEVDARALDLDRQTLGAGLTLQDKEMSAFQLELKKGPLRYRWTWDGTGGYDVMGDLHDHQLDLWGNAIGVHTFTHYIGHLRATSLYSKHEIIPSLGYAAEISYRNRSGAGLLALEYKGSPTSWADLRLKVQGRYYANGYAEDIVGRIEHDYVSIEQEDKEFTDSMNIFAIDDNVLVGAAVLDLKIRPTRWLYFFSHNELSDFEYRATSPERVYFYRHGFGICPRSIASECGALFVSNKILNGAGRITSRDTDNKWLFAQQFVIGSEARFAF